jgi:hypothetical protein
MDAIVVALKRLARLALKVSLGLPLDSIKDGIGLHLLSYP